jgi:hypothetical protein
VAKKLPDQLLQVVFNISNAVAAAAPLSGPISAVSSAVLHDPKQPACM